MGQREELEQASLRINGTPACREELERCHGQVWNEEELAAEFDVIGRAGPMVVVCRRSDSKLGSLMFQDSPRFYFAWMDDIAPR